MANGDLVTAVVVSGIPLEGSPEAPFPLEEYLSIIILLNDTSHAGNLSYHIVFSLSLCDEEVAVEELGQTLE